MHAPLVAYLHGFASGPGSRKAQFLLAKLKEHGLELLIPHLDEGQFAKLTITRQLEVIRQQVRGEDVVLIGSSLGGYLAALYAADNLNVQRLILLAPAFHFAELWAERMGAESLAAWQAAGTVNVYHYASGGQVPLGFGLYADALAYPPEPFFSQPTLLLHGTHDESVPLSQSQRIASQLPNVKLVELDCGHEMTEVLPEIWSHCHQFLSDALPLPSVF